MRYNLTVRMNGFTVLQARVGTGSWSKGLLSSPLLSALNDFPTDSPGHAGRLPRQPRPTREFRSH